MNLDFKNLRRPKKKKPAPVILSREEVEQIAVSVENLKHRLMIELCFTAGLWVSELVAVRVDQVNLGRQMIFIPGNGRDHKSCTTVFGFDLMDAVKRQIGNKKPDQYLFPSEKGGKLTTRMVSKFFKKALCASGIKNPPLRNRSVIPSQPLWSNRATIPSQSKTSSAKNPRSARAGKLPTPLRKTMTVKPYAEF